MKRWLTIFAACLCFGAPVHAAQVLCDPYIAISAYIGYGDDFLREGDLVMATYSYACAARGAPDNVEVRKRLALVYIKRGMNAEALETLRQIYGGEL